MIHFIKENYRALGILFFLALLFYPPRMGPVSELRGEEARRAIIAEGILENPENWVEPSVQGVRYIKKPPLVPWVITVTAAVSGKVNEWSVRFHAFAVTLIAVLCIFVFIYRRASPEVALLGSALFLTLRYVVYAGTIGVTDAWAMAIFTAAFLYWFDHFETGRLSQRVWIISGCILSVGLLAKGPVSLVYFLLAVILSLFQRFKYSDLRGFILCNFIACVPVVLWAVAIYQPGDWWVWTWDFLRFDPEATRLGTMLRSIKILPEILFNFQPWSYLVPLWMLHECFASRTKHVLFIRTSLGTILVMSLVILFIMPYPRPRYFFPLAPLLLISMAFLIEGWAGHFKVNLSQVTKGILLGLVAFGFLMLAGYAKYFQDHQDFLQEGRRADVTRFNRILEGTPLTVIGNDFFVFTYYLDSEVKRMGLTEFFEKNVEGYVLVAVSDFEALHEALEKKRKIKILGSVISGRGLMLHLEPL